MHELIGEIQERITSRSTTGKIDMGKQTLSFILVGILWVTSTLGDIGVGTPRESLEEAELVAVAVIKWDQSGRAKLLIREVLKGTAKADDELWVRSPKVPGALPFEITLFQLTNKGHDPFLFVGGYSEADREARLWWDASSAWPQGRSGLGFNDLPTLDECVIFAKKVIADQQLMAVVNREAVEGGVSAAADIPAATGKVHQEPKYQYARDQEQPRESGRAPTRRGVAVQRFPPIWRAAGVVGLLAFVFVLLRWLRKG